MIFAIIAKCDKNSVLKNSKHCQMSDIWQKCPPFRQALCLLGDTPKTPLLQKNFHLINNRFRLSVITETQQVSLT